MKKSLSVFLFSLLSITLHSMPIFAATNGDDHKQSSFTSIHHHSGEHPLSPLADQQKTDGVDLSVLGFEIVSRHEGASAFKSVKIDQDVSRATSFKEMLTELIYRRTAVKEQLDFQICATALLFAEKDRDEDFLKEQLKKIIHDNDSVVDNMASLREMNFSLRTWLADNDQLIALDEELSIYSVSLRKWLTKNDQLIVSGEDLRSHTTSLRRWLVGLLIIEMLSF